MTVYERIRVEPISGALGAEISGVDVAGELDAATIGEIRQALLEHLVIFFRDQELSVARHKSFTRRFGDIFVHPNYQLGQEDKEMVYLLRRPGDTSVAGEKWHADTTMTATPPMGAILHALKVAEYGGDTLFANQYLAYEALSDGMKEMLDGLKAVHSDIRVAGPQSDVNAKRSSQVRDDANWRPTVNAHPIVSVHPETVRKCLFVNPVYTMHIEGMTEAESGPILNFLYDHQCRPEFTCRFGWKPGSIAFWDNRCTVHLAVHDVFDRVRHMQRTQIAG
ncbi:MAG: taurine dioxygenase [Rhodospirillaceae bacterium]|jgi:taurine dioxygenase|nr:taurine dioxygenase [Rhodospirillaceae bacterium]MBT5191231.1 taurine dioxygenase [Rhodospirillaceae bacterium]MBT5897397.1 taurine dioxygenase [Rhodospirillaceae bacterium]MBT6429060.1 taurine dioxygenase [Rhodospirillaceae bacterium]MBT7755839.1 taurine dioxygenase [Rhodospirillaceae bacterium]